MCRCPLSCPAIGANAYVRSVRPGTETSELAAVTMPSTLTMKTSEGVVEVTGTSSRSRCLPGIVPARPRASRTEGPRPRRPRSGPHDGHPAHPARAGAHVVGTSRPRRGARLRRRTSSSTSRRRTPWRASAMSTWPSKSSAATSRRGPRASAKAGGVLVSVVGPVEARPAGGLAVDFVVEADRFQLVEIAPRVRTEDCERTSELSPHSTRPSQP